MGFEAVLGVAMGILLLVVALAIVLLGSDPGDREDPEGSASGRRSRKSAERAGPKRRD